MEKTELKNLTLAQMRDWVKTQGWPAFRRRSLASDDSATSTMSQASVGLAS